MTEQPTTQTAITWKQGAHSAVNGYVGKVKMFSYMYGISRNTHAPWELYTQLPGLKKNTQHATPEAAKAAAEQMLKIMLNTLIQAGVRTPQHLDAEPDQDA